MSDRPGDEDSPANDPPAGGFVWGLRPRDGAAPDEGTAAEPVAAEAAAPEDAAAEPLAPASPPELVPPPAPVPPPALPTSRFAPRTQPEPAPRDSPVEPPPTEPSPLAGPDAAGAASAWDESTQPMDALPPGPEPDATHEPSPDAGTAEPTEEAAARGPLAELSAAELLGAPAVAPEAGATSALETLFGEQNFRDYEAEPAEAPWARERTGVRERTGTRARDPLATISRTQKVLLAVAGGFVAVLALVALFLLGTRLADIMGAAPVATPSSSPSPSPSPSPSEEPVGPVEPGAHAWDELRGGECLEEYTDPWAEEFTVVDCAEPHPAQLVHRGVFAPSAEGVADDPFPGVDALQGQLSLLCTAPGVVDLAVAGQYPDVQFQGAYPATREQWDAGDRHYYCFVSRSSGEPLTGSVAVPPPPPAEPAAD